MFSSKPKTLFITSWGWVTKSTEPKIASFLEMLSEAKTDIRVFIKVKLSEIWNVFSPLFQAMMPHSNLLYFQAYL